MNNEELVALFSRVEDEFPVETWRVEGVPIWPLLRADIAWRNFFMFQRASTSTTERKRPLPLPLRAALDVASSVIDSVRARAADLPARDRLRPVDALLYSDGVSFTRIDGKFYERFCDPLAERLDAMGRRWQIVSPLNRYLVPRHSPSVFVQPWLEVARVRAAALARVRSPDARSLDRLDDALARMKEITPAGRFPDRHHVCRLAVYLESYQSVFARILNRTRPKAVFIVCYYGIEAMALVRECRARNIPTVDLQHGTMSSAHWAYASWRRLPPGGYETLPNEFWVWAASDAAVVSAWAESSSGAHRAFVSGNMMLDDWKDGTNAQAADYGRRMEERIRSASGRPTVLYSMNGYESEAQLDDLAELTRRSADRLFWWIRQHPSMQGDRERLARAIEASGATNVTIDNARDFPLYAVLRKMDAHVTEASSTTIEASAFGVPSVLLSREEAVMYRDLVDQGWAHVLREDEDIARAVEAQIARGPELRRAHEVAASHARSITGRLQSLLDAPDAQAGG